MVLISSISGIRGTIGGIPGEGLSPIDIVKYSGAYGAWVKTLGISEKPRVVLGRDARISGPMVSRLVISTLNALGIDVINLGMAATPTVELAVTEEKASGGIILTASHNPAEWNALKLLNSRGEFISDAEGKKIQEIAEGNSIEFSGVDNLGSITENGTYNLYHIKRILDLPLVDREIINKREFRVVVDCVNSVGGIVVPELLKSLGVHEIVEMNCSPTGDFSHNPEPLPEHLTEISEMVAKQKADLGIVVDPDVDRLALINPDGSMFGEEYTLVAIADYILQNKKGPVVSNLSSTQALKELAERYGVEYSASPVGEVHVVNEMKRKGAVIGGEGNGGVIYPGLHYGRDALVGIALFLTYLAKTGISSLDLKESYPRYFISKNKIEYSSGVDPEAIFNTLKEKFQGNEMDERDGLKIYLGKEWIHLRRSNTEPIIRIYTESISSEKADLLAQTIKNEIAGQK